MLQTVISNPAIWKARDLPATGEASIGVPTGFPKLDRLLFHGGWPRSGLTEVLCDRHGVGELRLLAPALSRLCTEEGRWLIWIHPPFTPYAPALASWGVATERILVVHPDSGQDALWCLEQALQSGSCSAALAWLDEWQLKSGEMRRLLNRAKRGNTWTVLFRPLRASRNPSPAELRIAIGPTPSETPNEVRLSILKRRGGWACDDLLAQLQGHAPPCSREAVRSLWRRWRRSLSNAHRSSKVA